MSDTSPIIMSPAAPSPRRRWGRMLPLLFLLTCITGVRSIYVSLYSSDIPFWDQWNLLDRTLAPLWTGNWPSLLEPHNEHRIAFTRLISMGLLALNGGIWSNLVESYANTLLYAAVLGLFYTLASRELDIRLTRTTLLIGVVVMGCLPFDWENTLVGFQSQFYLMSAGAILLVAIAAYRSPTMASLGLLAVVSAASLFTMASGLIAPLAVVVILILRMWEVPVRTSATLGIVLVMLAIALAGLALTPTIAGHAVLKAQGLTEHVRAMLTFLMWPLQPFTSKRSLFSLVVWWPLLAWALRFLRAQQSSAGEWFAVGMLVWVLLQGAAFAHARGHDATGLSSRYTGLAAIGLVANLALALQGLRHPSSSTRRRLVVGLIVLSMALVAVVLVRRTPFDLAAMHQRHQFLLIETYYTRAYLRDRNPDDLRHPDLMIPYIDGDRLRELLDNPAIVRLLPPLLASAVPMPQGGMVNQRSGGWLTGWATDLQRSVQHALGHTDVVPTFLPAAAPSATSFGDGACNIEAVNGVAATQVVALRDSDALLLDGWLIDASLEHSPSFNVILSSDAAFRFTARASGVRDDVVHVMHSQPTHTHGFSALGILNGVPAGDYTLILATDGPDERTICRSPTHVQIRH